MHPALQGRARETPPRGLNTHMAVENQGFGRGQDFQKGLGIGAGRAAHIQNPGRARGEIQHSGPLQGSRQGPRRAHGYGIHAHDERAVILFRAENAGPPGLGSAVPDRARQFRPAPLGIGHMPQHGHVGKGMAAVQRLPPDLGHSVDRRAARHGKLLGVNHPFLYQIVETVVEENEVHYTYLRERCDYITKVVKVEEENFARTIDGGMAIFSNMLAEHKAKGETEFSGADAFKLYDTYGFPIDLTLEMVADEDMTLNQAAFAQLMQEQKVRAREARKALGDLAWAGIDLGLDNTPTTFVGYTQNNCDAKVLAVCVGDEVSGTIAGGEKGIIVLDKTPFYAEMGGQIADQGVILMGNSRFVVSDVQKDKGGKYLHHGKMVTGSIKVDDIVVASIDVERRKAIMRAHSATHLLQKALQTVLGDHVHQAGSYVEPDRLRFDFTHYSALTPEELVKVNAIVQNSILEGYNIVTREMPVDEAKAMGATALFSEKYGSTVRVVNMGNYSIELCGGTHLDNTAKVGPFEIESECSVASGVRRIEAITGKACLERMERNQTMLLEAAAKLKTKPIELGTRIQAQLEELRELRRTIEAYKAKETVGEIDRILFGSHNVDGLKVITASVPNADTGRLRQMGDVLRDKDASVVAVLATVNEGKITFLAVCGKDAIARGIKAGDLVKQVCCCCGGSGGGKPDSAMGGGKDVTKVDNALAIVDDYVVSKLK